MTTELGTRKQGRSRRAVLLTIMALGTVVSLTAVNGVFAIFTDRATTGENSASSRGEVASADLQIALGSYDGDTGITTCGTYSEDLITGIISATDMVPSDTNAFGHVCLKNVGSRTVDLSASVIDLVDTDHACTGDEASVDETCGSDLTGELSARLQVFVFGPDCSNGGTSYGSTQVATMVAAPFEIDFLDPDEVTCLHLRVQDQASGDFITTTQSDTSTWRFAFDGTAV